MLGWTPPDPRDRASLCTEPLSCGDTPLWTAPAILSAAHALCHVFWEHREVHAQCWEAQLSWSRLAFSKEGRETPGRKGKSMIKDVETQEYRGSGVNRNKGQGRLAVRAAPGGTTLQSWKAGEADSWSCDPSLPRESGMAREDSVVCTLVR